MNKSEIHGSYMENQKALHAAKRLPTWHQKHIYITGASRPGSIGEAIIRMLQRNFATIISQEGDIREDRGDSPFLPDQYATFPYQHNVLILCHGVTHLDWIENCPREKVQEIFDVNVVATIERIQAFVRGTIENPWHKQIIVIGSMAHRAVLNGSAAYCASKAAINHFCRCAAWELAPKGYDVFCINPSNTLGAPMSEDTIQGLMRYRGLDRSEAEAYWGACLPKQQWLLPCNIADLVEFLLTGRGEYLSGSSIDLPGGQR